MSNSETLLGGVKIQENINMETFETWKGRGTCPSEATVSFTSEMFLTTIKQDHLLI